MTITTNLLVLTAAVFVAVTVSVVVAILAPIISRRGEWREW